MLVATVQEFVWEQTWLQVPALHWPRVEKEELWHWIPSAEFENVQVVLPAAGLVTTWHGLATHGTVHTPAAQAPLTMIEPGVAHGVSFALLV